MDQCLCCVCDVLYTNDIYLSNWSNLDMKNVIQFHKDLKQTILPVPSVP